MCMLTFLPEGVQPDPEALRNGADFNRDGHGFAIVNGKRLILRHSMDAEYAIAEFVRLRANHPDGPALFHSRFGTGGSVSEFNCHPFRIGSDRKTVLGHNGVLPSDVQPGKGEKRCDTRITAEVLLRGMNLGDPDVRKSIGQWMGTRNKFVILTVNPRYQQRAYIINEAAGVWHEGPTGVTWYSNRDFEGYDWKKYAVTTAIGGRRWYEDEVDECWQCGRTEDVDPDRNVCLGCNMCLDCGVDFDEACQCLYMPDIEPEPTPEYGYKDYERDFEKTAPTFNDLAEAGGGWSMD